MLTKLKNAIMKLYFMGDRWSLDLVESTTHELLDAFPKEYNKWNEIHWFYFRIAYTLIYHTRNLQAKGEYDATYTMIYVWYSYYPQIALNILEWLVWPSPTQFGCWKDMKHFANYVLSKTDEPKHPLIMKCVKILNLQLKRDQTVQETNVAKWIPREKSKYGWIFELLALDWCHMFDENYMLKFGVSMSDPEYQMKKWKAISGAKKRYRKVVSKLSRELGVTEIAMCNNWKSIDTTKVNFETLHKHRKIFTNIFENKTSMYQKKAYELYNHFAKHYVSCYELKSYSPPHTKSKGGMGGNKHLYKLMKWVDGLETKDAELSKSVFSDTMIVNQSVLPEYCDTKNQIDFTNRIWRSVCVSTPTMVNVLPILDMSLFMFEHQDVWQTALSLACLVAAKSTLASRILVMDHISTWVNVDKDIHALFKMEHKINRVSGKTNRSVESVVNVLAESFLKSKMKAEDIESLTLVFFSNSFEENEHDKIHKIYTEYFVSQQAIVPPLPHIVYWNVGGACQLPSKYDTSRVSWMSGTTTAGLDVFTNLQSKSRRIMNPFQNMCNTLLDPKYTEIFFSIVPTFPL
jgi:hypothetical protein